VGGEEVDVGATIRGLYTHRNDRGNHKFIDTADNMELVSGHLESKQGNERK
jgi:hypothetical protein